MLRLLILVGTLFSQGNLENFTERYKNPTATEVVNISAEFTTELDYNTSTSISPNVTEVPLITTTNKTFKSIILETSNLAHNQHEISCLCDLHKNACDIGCCCDKDCTYEMKKVFESCEEVAESQTDRNSCQYFERDYVNFTIHEWEIQNNDFLCVAKTNLPPSYTLQKEKPFRSYTETRLEIKSGNFWPQTNSEPSVSINFSEPYIQGVPIKYILSNTTMDIFKISESFFTSACDFRSNVSYLHDLYSQCVHAVDGNNQYLNVDYYRRILFIAQPEKLNTTILKKKLMTCPEPVCLKPKLKICTDTRLINCTSTNRTDIVLRCLEKNSSISCVDVLDSLKFIILHEGIEGIKNITLLIHLVNVTFETTEQYGMNQQISVVYEWASLKMNYSDILSGNPGYLIGKPILTAAVVNNTILRNFDNYQDYFLSLPYEDMGICEIGGYSYQPIEFGYSTILLCKVKGSFSVQNDSKPVDICRKMQTDIFKYWSIREVDGYFVNRTFGLFGNANSSIFEDWGDILFEKSPKDIVTNITGYFSNKNKTLNCYGLRFGLNIDIYHAKVDLQKLADQEKVLGITNQFHTSSNRSLTFDILNRKLFYEFDLDTRVTFWDITPQKLRRLIDPPSLNIELPSDFFYPFVKMGNGSIVLVPQLVLVFYSVLCKVFL